MIFILVEIVLFVGIILTLLAASESQKLAVSALLFGSYAWMFWVMIVIDNLAGGLISKE